MWEVQKEYHTRRRQIAEYTEDFLKAKGLWEEFLRFSETEDSKKEKANVNIPD